MKKFLLVKIRLSYYFYFFFFVYLGLSKIISGTVYAAGPLTLFSVNSFLYGFYISPVLATQKSRIEELHKIIRSEANALFDIALSLTRMPDRLHDRLQLMVQSYIKAKLRQRKPNSGEEEYEALITYCVEYKGEHKDQVDAVLQKIVANQQNRTNLTMQLAAKVFANEWQIMSILFAITLGFILTVQIPDGWEYHAIRALLCTALTMLIINLIKLNTLTHKKAKQMWQPLKKLLDTNFYRME